MCRNSQRPLTEIEVTHTQRKGTVPTKGGSSLSFQQRPAEYQHLGNWWRMPYVRLLDDALTNPSTGSSRLFHYQPMTKTSELDELPKVTNTSLKLYILNTSLKLLIPNKDTYIPKKRLTHFNTLIGGFNHFICIQGEFPHPLNGC